ncbi:protein Wnt-6-like isoform X2 [Ixodes scapularis]|uniref:protein Wnt-6 n=1 Tax=Ixodes scapularis TaxID=6945 RepID=UPI0011618E51|nr:protein Wnt-6 [Ixodes scapularis]XP_042144776.1 protein Wnt-6-like isoform X2 [Ixodes scapularis]
MDYALLRRTAASLVVVVLMALLLRTATTAKVSGGVNGIGHYNHNRRRLLDPKMEAYRESMAMRWQLLMEPARVCKKKKLLRGRKARICRKEPKVVREIARGVDLGIRECQNQFRFHRWNCSTHRSSMKKVLMKDTKEAGFVDAIVAAGVVYALTEACAQGRLLDCQCRRRHNSADSLGRSGCDHYVDFGYHKSRDFMNRKRVGDLRATILSHNYEAGRQAVRMHLERVCRCHGMSGTCSLKTCWRKLPTFSKVGLRLRDRFQGAIRVTAGNSGKGFIPESPRVPGREDIVFSEQSPDYCDPDRRTGSLGTRGRQCKLGASGPEDCRTLCCGRKVRSRQMVVSVACNCTFQYCCNVTCQTCFETLQETTCL